MTIYAIVNSSEGYKKRLSEEVVKNPNNALIREIIEDVKDSCSKTLGMRGVISLLKGEVSNVGEFSLIEFEAGDEIDVKLFGAVSEQASTADKLAEAIEDGDNTGVDAELGAIADKLAEQQDKAPALETTQAQDAMAVMKQATSDAKVAETTTKPEVETTATTTPEAAPEVESTVDSGSQEQETPKTEPEPETEYTQEQIDAAHKLVGATAGSAATKNDFKDTSDRRSYRKNTEIQDKIRADETMTRVIDAMENAGFPLVYVSRGRRLRFGVTTSEGYDADKPSSRKNTFIYLSGYGDPLGSNGFGAGIHAGGKSVSERYRFDEEGYCKKLNGGAKKTKEWVAPEDTTQAFIDWVLEAVSGNGVFTEFMK